MRLMFFRDDLKDSTEPDAKPINRPGAAVDELDYLGVCGLEEERDCASSTRRPDHDAPCNRQAIRRRDRVLYIGILSPRRLMNMSLKPTLRLPPTPSGLIFLVGQSPTAAKCPRPLESGAAAQTAEPPT